MNHRLAIIQLITPRLPLVLVAVRMPAITAWTRKNFGYTPLSLIFRHVREAKSRSIPPINYISHGGETVVIAPRINLTIQWAERLRYQLSQGELSVQQLQTKRRGALSTPHPISERNSLVLTTRVDRQAPNESGRAFYMPSVLSMCYSSIIGAHVHWEQKWKHEESSPRSKREPDGLRLISINHAQNPIRSQFGHGQPSFQRSHSEGSGTLSIHRPITEKNSQVLTTRTNRQEPKEIDRAFSIPSRLLRHYPPNIDALVQWEQKWIRAKRSHATIPGTEGLGQMGIDLAQHPIGYPLGYVQPSLQQRHRERSEALSKPHPSTERNRLVLTTRFDTQERKESSQTFTMPSVLLRRYSPTSGALVHWEQKWIRGQKSLEGLRLMSVDHAQHQKQMPQTVSMRSVNAKSDLIPIRAAIQLDTATSHTASSVSTFAAKSYLTLFNASERQAQAVKSIPILVSRRDLKMARRKNSAHDSVESTVWSTRVDDDVQFAGHRKRTGAIIPSLHQRRQDKLTNPASYGHFPRQPLPVNVGVQSRFLEWFRVSEVQKCDLKLVTDKISAPGPIESTSISTQADEDFHFAGHQKRADAAMLSLRQRLQEPAIIPTSNLYFLRQPLPASIERKSKFLERNPAPQVQSKVYRCMRIASHGFLITNGRRKRAHPANLYSRSVRGTFDQVGSAVDLPSNIHMPFHARPTADHGYAPWRAKSSINDRSIKQPTGWRQPDASHERRISSADVIYRRENTQSPPPTATVQSVSETVPSQPPRIDIERLSRDVWLQLEKRIRIERERHGRL